MRMKEWTPELVKIEALKYNQRRRFKMANPYAYRMAIKFKVLQEACAHMGKPENESWTIEELTVEALKYPSKVAFEIGHVNMYAASKRRGLLEQISGHMSRPTDISTSELELFNFIKNKFPSTKKLKDRRVRIADRPYIKGFDIDIFIPGLNKGIEFDGTYWHSLAGIKRGRPLWPDEEIQNYHMVKDAYFKSKGIEILHIPQLEYETIKEPCIAKCLQFLENK
jgi:hypothetical protein